MKQCSRLKFSEKHKLANLRHLSRLLLVVLWVVVLRSGYGQAQDLDANTPSQENVGTRELPIHIKGVFPKLTVMAEGLGSNSEAGIGALIPWADKLWAIGYVSHIKGKGLGLYEISDDMTMRRHPASVTGRAKRLLHNCSITSETIRIVALDFIFLLSIISMLLIICSMCTSNAACKN